MIVLTIVFGMFGGMCFGILPQQSAFVAACLSLSSTPLIVKFLGSKHGEHTKKGRKCHSVQMLQLNPIYF